MQLVGLKDTKTGGFMNVTSVPSVDNYKNLIMQQLQDVNNPLHECASDYEVVSFGEMDGSGCVASDVQFVCNVQTIVIEVKNSWLDWHKKQVEVLSSELDLDVDCSQVEENDGDN